MFIDIIGAGIAGPMAALAMAKRGHSVTVYEQRETKELNSHGILGITNENWARLAELGVNLASRELMNEYHNMDTGETFRSPFRYITWVDLHTGLVRAAWDAGVRFFWGTRPSAEILRDADVIVYATGIGSASQVSRATYTGYVIYRGLSSEKADTAWDMGHYTDYQTGDMFTFTIGDTRDGASITLFVKRDSVAEYRTTVTKTPPPEAYMVPAKYWPMVDTVPEWQVSPMSDWTVPGKLTNQKLAGMSGQPDGYPVTVRIGDANGQLRPATSMGANLALNEGYRIMELIAPTDAEVNAIFTRLQWTQRGQQMGV